MECNSDFWRLKSGNIFLFYVCLFSVILHGWYYAFVYCLIYNLYINKSKNRKCSYNFETKLNFCIIFTYLYYFYTFASYQKIVLYSCLHFRTVDFEHIVDSCRLSAATILWKKTLILPLGALILALVCWTLNNNFNQSFRFMVSASSSRPLFFGIHRCPLHSRRAIHRHHYRLY